MNRYWYLFLILSAYYIFAPLFFIFDNMFSNSSIFLHEVNYLQKQRPELIIFFNFISFILIFLTFFFLKHLLVDKINSSSVQLDYKFFFTLLIWISIFFLLLDFINIIKFYQLNYPNINRSLIYYGTLNKRMSHYFLLILLSVINFKNNKKLSYFCFLLIIIFDLLTLSRIGIGLLFLLIFFTIFKKIKINLKIFFYISIILHLIILYRFFLTNQPILYILIEPLHVFLSSVKYFTNIFFSKNLHIVIYDNFIFILKDFFYFNLPINNLTKIDELPQYASRGSDFSIYYFLAAFLYLYIFKKLLNFFFISIDFNICIFVFLTFSLFRGHFVHNIGFIIKLYIVSIIASWLIRKVKLLLLKAG